MSRRAPLPHPRPGTTTRVRIPAAALRRGRSGHEVHALQVDGPAGDPTTQPLFVCVHGLGGSHLNWRLLAPLLAARGPVWAPDLAGFGLTPLGTRTASIDDNLDLVQGFVRTVAEGRPVVLIGNSMGGALSLLTAARQPGLLRAMVLVNPALPASQSGSIDAMIVRDFAAMVVPVVGERFLQRRALRWTPEEQVAETMRRCAADPASIDPEVLREHAAMVAVRREMAWAPAAYLQATRTLLLRLGLGARGYWAAAAAVTTPTLLVHGSLDKLVGVAATQMLARRNPTFTHLEWDDLGHVPMLEDPRRVAAAIMAWLDGVVGGTAAA